MPSAEIILPVTTVYKCTVTMHRQMALQWRVGFGSIESFLSIYTLNKLAVSLDAVEDEIESEIDEEVMSARTETGGETEDSEVVMGSPKSRPQSQLGTIVSETGGLFYFACYECLIIDCSYTCTFPCSFQVT